MWRNLGQEVFKDEFGRIPIMPDTAGNSLGNDRILLLPTVPLLSLQSPVTGELKSPSWLSCLSVRTVPGLNGS